MKEIAKWVYGDFVFPFQNCIFLKQIESLDDRYLVQAEKERNEFFLLIKHKTTEVKHREKEEGRTKEER